MLVLTRKPTESITIAENVVVTLLGISGNRVRIGIEAPSEIDIRRTELLETPAAIHDAKVRLEPTGPVAAEKNRVVEDE